MATSSAKPSGAFMPDTVLRANRERSAVRWKPIAVAIAFALVVLDQVTKSLILSHLELGERIEVTGFFNLVLAMNRGAAFSFLASQSGWQVVFFSGIAIVAILVIGVLLYRAPDRGPYILGLALILGGAAGNLVDRLRHGAVVDFLDFHFGGWHWPAFNVADSALTVGAALLILESFVQPKVEGSGEARG
jgi:signal peptidase II